jgi:hypothetical protein
MSKNGKAAKPAVSARSIFVPSVVLALATLGACDAIKGAAPKADAPAAATAPAPTAAAVSAPATSSPASVSVQAGTRVSSPLKITGKAPNSWFHEAQFDASLIAADGTEIVIAPARAQDDWMIEGPVAYASELAFEVKVETPATLRIEKWVSEGMEVAPNERVDIPVILMPK